MIHWLKIIFNKKLYRGLIQEFGNLLKPELKSKIIQKATKIIKLLI